MTKGDDDGASDALHELARLARARTVPWTPELRAVAQRTKWCPAHLGREGGAPVRVKRLGRARHDTDTTLVHVDGEDEPRYIARSRIEKGENE